MKSSWILAATLSIGLVACGGDRAASTSATEQTKATAASEQVATGHQMSPEELGELGARIEKEPGKATEMLKEHGLDERSFERQIRQVTENPDSSKRYAEAYRRAKA